MARLNTVQANGIAMECLEDGPRDGAAILLIHGLGWDAARLWADVTPALAEAGFRVLAPNLRGVGSSDATHTAYTTDLYAADMNGFLDAAEISRAIVVGFSMGASIAAAMLPQSNRVAALSLACGGLHSTEAGREGTERMLARAKALGPEAFAVEQAEAIFRAEWADSNPKAVEDFKRWRAAMNQDALFRAFRSGYGIDYRETVCAAGLPTQVIAADGDAFCHLEDMRRMAALIPAARFDVIPACGHMATIERPAQFNSALLDFLRSVTVAA